MTRKPFKQDEKIQYAVYAAIALLMGALMAWQRDLFSSASFQAAAGILSDCFFVPGVLLAGAGAMGWIGSKGTFDSLGYAFSRFSLHNLWPNEHTAKRPETLYEYKQKQDEKGRKWSKPLVFTGLGAMAFAVAWLLVYLLA